jgi:hypothetical protein
MLLTVYECDSFSAQHGTVGFSHLRVVPCGVHTDEHLSINMNRQTSRSHPPHCRTQTQHAYELLDLQLCFAWPTKLVILSSGLILSSA